MLLLLLLLLLLLNLTTLPITSVEGFSHRLDATLGRTNIGLVESLVLRGAVLQRKSSLVKNQWRESNKKHQMIADQPPPRVS